MATELVRRRVSVIATPASGTAALAAKAATATLPIVFSAGGDTVQLGLVASLNRPSGNVTGFSEMNTELASKRLGLMHELVPAATRFAVLNNSTVPPALNAPADSQAVTAAAAIGRQVKFFAASTVAEIDAALASMSQKRIDALLVTPNPLFSAHRVQLATLAARYAIPAIYWNRPQVEAGGLMSYGSNVRDQSRQVGVYVGRVLTGEKPAEMPVQQPTKFDLFINARTAKTSAWPYRPRCWQSPTRSSNRDFATRNC